MPDPPFDDVARSSFFGYAAPGAYTVALRVTNVYTTTSVSRQVEAIPTLSTDFAIVRSERTITVTATAADADSWSWDFGDGATASGRTATHTYLAPAGVYPLQLTVKATNGCRTLGGQYVDLRSKVYLPIALRGYH